MPQTTEVVSPKGVPTTDCFWQRTTDFIKRNVRSPGVFLRLHNDGLKLITLPLVTGGVDQLRITDYSCPCLWSQTIILFMLVRDQTSTKTTCAAQLILDDNHQLSMRFSSKPKAHGPNKHWQQITEALHSSVSATQGSLSHKHQKVELLDARRSLPSEATYGEARGSLRRQLTKNLKSVPKQCRTGKYRKIEKAVGPDRSLPSFFNDGG